MNDVILKDFCPWNTWREELYGVIDETTNRRYLNDSRSVVSLKCFMLTVGTPVVHLIAGVINIAYRILRILIGYHFWKEGELSFTARLAEAGVDLLRIVLAPLAFVGLELSAIYGIFNPYDGRKLYASFERAQYDKFILAPCFQPDPTQHLFGGDIKRPNQF